MEIKYVFLELYRVNTTLDFSSFTFRFLRYFVSREPDQMIHCQVAPKRHGISLRIYCIPMVSCEAVEKINRQLTLSKTSFGIFVIAISINKIANKRLKPHATKGLATRCL